MRASEFNRRYPPGSHFIYQSCSALRGECPLKHWMWRVILNAPPSLRLAQYRILRILIL